MNAPHTTVPSRYLGVWQRTLLEQQGTQDTTTLVLWLQTAQRHADIRIPASRPDFAACASLVDCSNEQLRWLSTQQGFAGVTEVRGKVCEWRREMDFQPTTGSRDIGEMVFADENTLLETGIESTYFEIWKKVEQSHLSISIHQVYGKNRHGVAARAQLLKAGNQFVYIRPRSVSLPPAIDLLAAIDRENPNRDMLMDWLDFEISFGVLTDDGEGRIQHSTLPFREGSSISL